MAVLCAVVNVLSTVYDLDLPDSYKEIIAITAIFRFDYLSLLYPGACLNVTIQEWLTLYVTIPFVVIGIVMACGICYRAFRDRMLGWHQVKEGLLATMSISLIITFMMSPSVSARILGTWDCLDYEDDSELKTTKSFLRRDQRMRCSGHGFDNPEYDSLSRVSIGYMFLWPVRASFIVNKSTKCVIPLFNRFR